MTYLNTLIESIRDTLSEAVSKEEKAVYTAFTKKLKAHLQRKWGIKLRAKTSGSVQANPFIGIIVANDRQDKIPNEFRLAAVGVFGGRPLNPENVVYGNIQPDRITLKHSEWLKLVGNL